MTLQGEASKGSSTDAQSVAKLSDLSPQQWKSGIAAWLGWLFDGLDMHLYVLVATPFVAELLGPLHQPGEGVHRLYVSQDTAMATLNDKSSMVPACIACKHMREWAHVARYTHEIGLDP